jgi:hypothetical protein
MIQEIAVWRFFRSVSERSLIVHDSEEPVRTWSFESAVSWDIRRSMPTLLNAVEEA